MTITVSNGALVALRAYYIWENEGRPHGRHETHWFAAEAAETAAAGPYAVVTASAKKAATTKAPAAKKIASSKRFATAKAPEAPTEAIVAAAALATSRTAQRSTKGARRAH